MTNRSRVCPATLIAALCLCASVSLAAVSSTRAVRIANDYLRHHKIAVDSLKATVKLRREPGDDVTDPIVRNKLVHRKHWWVHLTPNPPVGPYPENPVTIFGGAHSIYVAPDTGEVLGWCSER